MSGEPTSKEALPAPGPARGCTGGTGRGSESALDAMLKKRREGENRTADELFLPENLKGASDNK